MKPGIPWSVKGIEPEVREVAKHAARRSGMTLGEWLNTVILDQAEDSASPQPHVASYPQKEISEMTPEAPVRARSETTIRLEDIAQQLSRLAQQEQEAAVIRSYEPPARQADQEMMNRILGRIEANERQSLEALTAVNERLAALGRQISQAAQAPPKVIEKPEDVPGYQALEGALRNIVDHIEISERRTRDSLKTMQDRLGDMAQRATQGPSDDLIRSAPAFAGLEQRLNDLAVRVQRNEVNAEQVFADTLKRELGQLSGRIDHVQRHTEQMVSAAEMAAGQTAQKELHDIELRIQTLLRETQATMASQQVGAGDVQRLKTEIGNLTQRIEEVHGAAASERDVNALRVAVEQLSARMAQGPDLRPLADMDRRLADLTQRLEHDNANPRHLSQLGELERRIAELDHRLADAIRLQGDGQAMVALEQHLSDVNGRLATAEQQLGHLGTIERAITQLFDGLEQQRTETGKVIEDAAQRAAQQALQAQPSLKGSPEIRALEEGLRAVRESADQSDRRSQETLEAVHETLEQIVTKLAELETSAAGHQLAATMSQQAMASAAQTQPAWQQPAPQATWDEPPPQAMPDFGQPAFDPVTSIPEPQFPPAPQVQHNPFVAQAPATAPRLEMAAPQPVPDFSQALPADDLPGDDFIAAARRAAQAAAGRTNFNNPAERPPIKKGANSKFNLSLPFLNSSRKAAPAAIPGTPQPVPILKAPASASEKRRKLILAGIVLLAAVSAFTFNMLARNAKPQQPAAIEQPATPDLAAPKQTSALDSKNSINPIGTGLTPPDDTAFDTPGSLGDITGSLPAAKTDASLTSIVAEPGTMASQAELPPAEIGTGSLRQAAARGDAKAQFIVASRYLDGEGIEQDVSKAAQWYQQAATQGLAPAQYRVATLYERGKGVPKDVATAFVWYERAAAGGNVKAMHNAAVIAAGSELGAPNYDKAFRWFKEAADRGLQDSQFNLAVLYERGLGTAINPQEAYFWYSMAAANNDAGAQARAAKIAAKLKPDEALAIKSRAAAFSPLAADQEANFVAVTDDSWKGPEAPAANMMPEPAKPAPLSGNPVEATQKMLMRLGYNVGEPDGKLGGRTANAIRLFQLQSGMKVTGEVSPELILMMENKINTTGGA